MNKHKHALHTKCARSINMAKAKNAVQDFLCLIYKCNTTFLPRILFYIIFFLLFLTVFVVFPIPVTCFSVSSAIILEIRSLFHFWYTYFMYEPELTVRRLPFSYRVYCTENQMTSVESSPSECRAYLLMELLYNIMRNRWKIHRHFLIF